MSGLEWLRHHRETSRSAWKRVRSWGRHSLKHMWANRGRLAVLVFLIVAVGGGVWTLVHFWDWLQTETVNGVVGKESGSTTVRNIGFVVAGLIALPFAVWRSWVAQRQANTAQQNLLNERYQRGAEMLGSDVFSVRLAGIYALKRLAAECPEQYHIQVMQLFCSFARRPPKDEDVEISWVSEEFEFRGLRTDVQEVMMAISDCHAEHLHLEKAAKFRLDLKGAKLSGLQLEDASLSGAELAGSDLSQAQLPSGNLSDIRCWDANLSGTDLRCANLSGAYFGRTDFRDTQFRHTTLSGAEFDPGGPALFAASLTQVQLDQARADAENPPKLRRMLDPQTGEPLVWRDKRLESQA